MKRGLLYIIGIVLFISSFMLVFNYVEAEYFYVEDEVIVSGTLLQENFDILYQKPELPTGCEITAMTSVLNYYGFAADKVVMARTYLPTQPYVLYEGEDGRVYGPDLKHYFAGNPEGIGYVCGPEAIVTASNQYLTDMGSGLRAKNISGTEPEDLYQMVADNIPVAVWTTIGMNPREPEEGWYTETGDYVDWSRNDHCSVLIGCDEAQVMLADPISGYVVFDKAVFEQIYNSRGRGCVVLE